MKNLIVISLLSFFAFNSINAQIHYNHPKFMPYVFNCINKKCNAESEYSGHQMVECGNCKKAFGDRCCAVKRPMPHMPRRSYSYCPHCNAHWGSGDAWNLLGYLDVRIRDEEK